MSAVGRDRVGVFIDYQNVYRRSRFAFCDDPDTTPAQFGQVFPLLLAQRLVSKRVRPSELVLARVYRGQPVASRDAKAAAAFERQVKRWAQDEPLLGVRSRPLRYPHLSTRDEKPGEKGVDVEMAVELLLGALDRAFDVAIVVSQDSDQVPAIEAVIARTGCHVEVAAWSAKGTQPSRITLPGRKIWCHRLDLADFEAVSDRTDYTK